MAHRLRFDVDGRDWPNREASRFVEAGGLRFHVQVMGSGPPLLLLHGTGASTHSWRDLAPLLAARRTLVAPDLPGHGFTTMPDGAGLSLAGMARSLAELMRALGVGASLAAGHSAGAAILARMALDRRLAPDAIISLNGALTPMRGLSGRLFAPVAKTLAATSLTARLFAWQASGAGVVERLIRDTGSRLDPRGVELYRRLAGNSGHVAAALGMMANWDLERLERELPRLTCPLILVAGTADRAIPSSEAFRVRDAVPGARVELLKGLGHLAHEEEPQRVAELILAAARPAEAAAS